MSLLPFYARWMRPCLNQTPVPSRWLVSSLGYSSASLSILRRPRHSVPCVVAPALWFSTTPIYAIGPPRRPLKVPPTTKAGSLPPRGFEPYFTPTDGENNGNSSNAKDATGKSKLEADQKNTSNEVDVQEEAGNSEASEKGSRKARNGLRKEKESSNSARSEDDDIQKIGEEIKTWLAQMLKENDELPQSDKKKARFRILGKKQVSQDKKTRKDEEETENNEEAGEETAFSSSKKSKSSRDSQSKLENVKIFKINVNMLSILAGLLALAMYYSVSQEGTYETTWQTFRTSMLARGAVERIVVANKNMAYIYLRPDAPNFQEIPGLRRYGYQYYMMLGSAELFDQRLEDTQRELGIPLNERIPVTYTTQINLLPLFLNAAPTLLLIGSLVWFARRAAQASGGSGGLLGMNKSRAKLFNMDTDVHITFKDVAGIDEAKEEIMEFVKFLKDPGVYERLGAKIPRGAILSGPPGTGKTLLAKATAGEANVPFFSVSGSEFVEMFVGVGASRVRDLFATARKHTPCILFIDEIDAIGKARGRHGSLGGNDERESTLNQILVEIDGFSSSEHIVVLAGTNRPDVLDPALMRPGRFDRHIVIDKPDIHGRQQIFRVHLQPIKLDPLEDADALVRRLAAMTPGFSGADIHNVCNEAALIAARYRQTSVRTTHFEQAIERVIAGLEKKSKVLSADEKRIVAYHEAGHAVAGWFLEHVDPLLKVSIIPRGSAALGYAQYLPKDMYLYSQAHLLDRLCMTLAGRVSEELFFNSITTGAQDDLQKVTKLAYAMLTQYGMNPRIGNLSFPNLDQNDRFTKPFSEATGQLIDAEVRSLVRDAYARTVELLKGQRAAIEVVAQRLLEKEVLNREDMVQLLGPRPFKDKFVLEEYIQGHKNYDGTQRDVVPNPKSEPKEDEPRV